MRVAIDISALSTGHRERGVGSYTENLSKSLSSYEPDILCQKIDTRISASENNTILSNIDILHYTYLDLFHHTFRFSSDYKVVVTIHDVIPLVFPQHFPAGIRGSINLFLMKRALPKISAFITDSHNSKKDIIEQLSISPEQVTVVPLAAGENMKSLSKSELTNLQLKRKYNIPQRYILYVGDVNWNKNLLVLLSAFKEVQSKGVNLVMTGKALVDENTPETREIIKHIENLGLHDSVKRLGFVSNEELVGLYNGAMGYIQPSLYEGFGLPVLEAMQCGTPVICSNASSLVEIAGDAALYVNPHKVSDIAKGLKKLIDMKNDQRNILIDHGLQQAKKFSWKKVAHETVHVYRSILRNL